MEIIYQETKQKIGTSILRLFILDNRNLIVNIDYNKSKVVKRHKLGNFRNMRIDEFLIDLGLEFDSDRNVQQLHESFKIAPYKTKVICDKPIQPWYTNELNFSIER